MTRRALALAAVAVVAVLLWRGGPPERRHLAEDPAVGLAPRAAYDRALVLGRAGRHLESLPYFRRAAADPAAPLGVVLDLAAALNNTALQVRSHLGVPSPTTRSSWERVALMRECLATLERARALAREPREAALVHAHRADRYVLWGMPWEAYVEFRRAEALDSKWRGEADRIAASIARPETRP